MKTTYQVLCRVPGHAWSEYSPVLDDKTRAEVIAKNLMDASPEVQVKIQLHTAKPRARKGRRG